MTIAGPNRFHAPDAPFVRPNGFTKGARSVGLEQEFARGLLQMI